MCLFLRLGEASPAPGATDTPLSNKGSWEGGRGRGRGRWRGGGERGRGERKLLVGSTQKDANSSSFHLEFRA